MSDRPARNPKASDITDAEVIAAIIATRGLFGVPEWSSRFSVEGELRHFPPKVVLAKIRSMIRRRIIKGCGCGCRGDLEIP
jgi:hypothetical protein